MGFWAAAGVVFEVQRVQGLDAQKGRLGGLGSRASGLRGIGEGVPSFPFGNQEEDVRGLARL